MEKSTKRVATYRRVSSDEQVEGNSLEAQRDTMRQYAESKDWEIVTEYEDGGYSGGNDDRPAFKRMIAAALDGEFEIVLVHKLDRFSRNREDAIVYKSQLKKKGIRIVSVSEPLDDSPASMITEAVLEAYNEYFLVNLAHEIRKGKYKGAQNGDYQGGTLKLGYTLNDGKIVADKEEADTVNLIFQRYANGTSISKLVEWLNAQGKPCKKNGQWFVQKVSRILKDRTYIGEGKYGQVIMPYPPIVETDLFNRVQSKLNHNKKHTGPNKRLYMLRSLGRCGECGGALLHETQRQYRYTYCYNQATYPDQYQCHKPWLLNLNPIEDVIWAEVAECLQSYRDNTYELLLQQYEDAKGERDTQIVKAQRNVERCKQERQTVLKQIRKGNITQADADVEFTLLNKEQSHWESELSGLMSLSTDADTIWERFWSQLKAINLSFDYGFDAAPEQKRELLNSMLDSFVLYGNGKIELRFKLPVNDRQVAESIRDLSCDALVS